MLNRIVGLLTSVCLVLLLSACNTTSNDTNSGEHPYRVIIPITGDLYEARDRLHNTVFLVTPEGVILGDPMGVETAQWLKQEIAARFDATVKYVIYSHHHPEHATGGNVFADTATFVAHENAVAALNAAFPSNAGQMDRNGNGRIERVEATDPGYPQNFDIYNRDGDDAITGEEINADTPMPDIVYADHMSITLGGSRVELIHPGSGHTDDMTVLLFPEEDTIFGADIFHVRRFGVSLNGYSVAAYETSINNLNQFEFDTVIAGHGDIIGEKADLTFYLGFLQELNAG